MEKQLLRFLNDQRFRWVSSLILLVGFFIGSLQDVNYEFSIAVLEGMFPAFVNVNIRMYNFDDVQCTVIPSVAYGFVTGMNLQLC